MRNQLIVTVLFFSFLTNALCCEVKFDTFLDQEIEQLSYYMGYLIGRDHAKNSYGFPSHFDKIVEGMKAGIAGEPIPENKEIVLLIKRMQKNVVERQAALNLQAAENYLENLTIRQPELVRIEPSKLFYFVQKQGNGPFIENRTWFHFRMSELKEGELRLIYSTYEDKGEPLQVDLEAVVPGFQRGAQGMQIGEERIIYVHPDLAFGLGKLDIAPNRLIVFEIVACPPSTF